ncbi:MAG: hypothetical protein ACRDAI_03710 [Candidatus Rhabdochlamydia sp.]
MSSITNPSFSLHNPGMEANKVEIKGKKGRQCPDVTKVGPIPPKRYQNPDVMYIDPFPRPAPAPQQKKNTALVSRDAEDEKAREAFNAYYNKRQADTRQYTNAHASNPNYGLSSNSASAGSKSLAVYSSATSSGSKAPAVFSSKVSGGKSLL